MLLKIYKDNTNPRDVQKVVSILEKGGIVIFPTDTIYGIGCSLNHIKSLDKIAQIKRTKIEDSHFSFLCHDLSTLSEYTKPLSNTIFKLMKRNLPGPFTFILNSSNKVPKLLKSKKKTVGIRVPNNNIIRAIIEELGCPILSSSIYDEDRIVEYTTDPELIYERYQNIVNLVIDGGTGSNIPSAIVDCTADDVVIVREGPQELIE